MFPYKQVVVLQIFLKYELQYCERELKALRQALGRNAHPCMHERRHIAFVITTQESPSELVQRLSDVLEVDNIEDWTAGVMLGGCVGKHGVMNSFVTKVNLAYRALQNGPTKYLRDRQTFIVPDVCKRASRKMSVKGPSAR